jgi:HAD superfamily hydrolase (TIGR01458 family)
MRVHDVPIPLPPSGVLIDLDGVICQKGALIAGAADALARLDAHRLAYRILTNTTSKPLAAILRELEQLGLRIARSLVLTPAIAARSVIEAEGLNPFLLVRPSLLEDLPVPRPGPRNAVVIADAGDDLSYANLNTAFRLIEKGAAFLSLAGNRYFLDRDGALSLDVGAFAAALEYATGRKARVLGKPSPDFFRLAVAGMGVAPERTVMIGDDAEFDVHAAMQAGLHGVLVRTGKWKPGDDTRMHPPPTAIFDAFPQAIDWMLAAQSGGA